MVRSFYVVRSAMTGLLPDLPPRYDRTMTTPVNLNRYRKDKARAEKRAKADSNAAKFGRTRAEKALDAARSDKATRSLDAHRIAAAEDTPET